MTLAVALQPRYSVRAKGRRPLTCYHEAGHCLARWFFGHSADRAVVLTVEEVRAGAWPVDRRGRTMECEGAVEGYDIGPNPHLPVVPLASETPEHVRKLYEQHQAIGTEMALVDNAIGIEAEARYTKRSAFACVLNGGMEDVAHSRLLLDMRFPDPAEREAASLLGERRARALVRSAPGWQAIASVAAGLLEHGELDWHDDIAPRISAAYGDRVPGRGPVMDRWPWLLEMFRSGDVAEQQPRPDTPGGA
ncbi:MAG: hypothetical protein ACRYHQ_14970 [Janthinobacterium lividum]